MDGGHCFISYSTDDADTATALCAILEGLGHPCWIAPRDIASGASYGEAIVQAIGGAGALVMLASSASAKSQHVARELERAVNERRRIIPVRLDGASFTDEMTYYLAGVHWLDGQGMSVETLAAELSDRLQDDGAAFEPSPRAAVADPRRGVSDRVLDALLAAPPPLVGVALSAVGLLVCGFAMLLGFGEFSYLLETEAGSVAKQAGFLWAFNWSLSFILIYPAMATVGLMTIREAATLGERLAARGMIVDARLRPAHPAEAANIYRRGLLRAVRASLLVAALLVVYAAWEFYEVVARHYFLSDAELASGSLANATLERDWSVAALLIPADGVSPNRMANLIFSGAVYMLFVGAGTSLIVAILVAALTTAGVTLGLAEEKGAHVLVPDVRDPAGRQKFDDRCGFEAFERMVRLALMTVLLSFCIFVAIHLQNLYLRSTSPHILDFLGLTADGAATLELMSAGSLRAALSNLNSAIALLVMSLLVIGALFGFAGTMRLAAKRSRAALIARLENENEPLPTHLADLGRERALGRLDAMRTWCADWPKLGHILLALPLTAAAFAFYRLGAVAVLLILCFAAWRAWVVFAGEDRR